jgi:hypothetical protein
VGFCECSNERSSSVECWEVLVPVQLAALLNSGQLPLLSKAFIEFIHKKTKLHGLSPRANYTDRATAACRRSNCQLSLLSNGSANTFPRQGIREIIGFSDACVCGVCAR